ncbi:MAG: Exodeoxyribonuclease [Gammaproteobacteria bacterium]|nr:Exodeoxyribonuclease [Gammaproteobacteria bacterium]
MSITLATWNINSLRVRLEQVLAWLQEHKPDVLALQEIKVTDELFPVEVFTALGYHVAVLGQPTYNGVAILSRVPLKDVVAGIPDYDDPQKRVLAATVGELRVICVYVPNGASVDSEKYVYKLQWFDRLLAYVKNTLTAHPQTIILGDYNIAPEDRDVHDPVAWQGHALVSPKERACFEALLALGLSDTFRVLAPEDNSYTWWDYRMNGFKRNHGLRIDHILATPAVMARAERCVIDKLPRALDRPSDHTPVILQLSA